MMKGREIALFAAILRRLGMEAHPRLVAATGLAVILGGVCLALGLCGFSALQVPCITCLILAFDAGAAVFILRVLAMMTHASVIDMKTLANMEDERRNTRLVIGSVVATATLFALFGELRGLANQDAGGAAFHAAIAIATIVLSWSFMNTMFALHYAH